MGIKQQIIDWLEDGGESLSAEIFSQCKLKVSTSGGLSVRPDGVSYRHSKVEIYAPRIIFDSIRESMATQRMEIEAAIHLCAKANELEVNHEIHWLPLIQNKQSKTIRPKKESHIPVKNDKSSDSVDIVIITALLKEQDAVLRHLDSTERIQSKNRVYYKGEIPHSQGADSYSVVVLSLPGMGNVQAAIATSQAITVWNPTHVILVGITAGLKEKDLHWDSRWLGDILVAEQIVGYEPGKVIDGKTNRRYEVVRPAFNLIESARNLPVENWVLSGKMPRPDGSSSRIIPKVHFGVVASGEKVIADNDFAQELKTHWSKLAGIEMESYGTALAAYQADSAPGMLMVKGICDWADSDKNDAWQEYAADISGAFIIACLKQSPFESSQREQAARKESVQYTGKIKLALTKRIGDDWRDLADYFQIPRYKRDRFAKGYEMQEAWEWLEDRNKLDGLKDALVFIERHDLIDLFD
ncbi:MAG: hypothetical protein SWO11_07400 [Thermodesulfobacteriota bacterium]|nr:hypothetical protein [Thermodesulfobacteriota bacterium]